jgi:hypothetical protein
LEVKFSSALVKRHIKTGITGCSYKKSDDIRKNSCKIGQIQIQDEEFVFYGLVTEKVKRDISL